MFLCGTGYTVALPCVVSDLIILLSRYLHDVYFVRRGCAGGHGVLGRVCGLFSWCTSVAAVITLFFLRVYGVRLLCTVVRYLWRRVLRCAVLVALLLRCVIFMK
mgnify:CR=1 FL=1